ncbi:MAG: GH1 family beta-glucosidase [Planctomycetota bacterium]
MTFPSDFVWGCATSAYQIEGGHDADGKGPSIWDEFCRVPGRVRGGDTGDTAADHFNCFKDDVSIMKSIGIRAYRFSISWPRIIPDGVGDINERGLAFYDRLVDELLTAGIEPWATLFHWDLPAGVQRRGGWLNPSVVDWFERYSQTVVARLSDRVSHWMTFNEPQVFIGMGYSVGEHAPGLRLAMPDLIRMTHNVHLAHGRAVRVIREHAKIPARIGWAPECKIGIPHDVESIADAEAAVAFMAETGTDPIRSNTWWSDPVFLGTYPDDGLSRFGKWLPTGWERNLPLIQESLDFCGANIYLGSRVQADTEVESGHRIVSPAPGTPRSGFGWEVTPPVLFWGPKFLAERYGLPIFVTENGMASPDWVDRNGRVEDPQRVDFLARHLAELRKALDGGIPVGGYFVWSLLDNFEWAEGFHQRFGIVHIDFETLARTPKLSSAFYREAIKSNGASIQASR